MKIRHLRINFGALPQSDFVLPMIPGAGVWGEVLNIMLPRINFGALPQSDFAVLPIIVGPGVWGRERPQPPEAKFSKIRLLRINFGALPEKKGGELMFSPTQKLLGNPPP